MNEKLNILGGVKALSKYIKKYKLNFILFYIGWLFDSILTVITPIIFSIMIDEIVYYKNIHVFLRVSLVFVIMSIFSCILYFFIYAQHHYLMIMYSFDIKLDVFKKMQSMKASYMSNAKTGDIITTLLGDTGDCIHFVIRNVIHLINSILRGIFYIVYIYIISVQAGLLVTLFLPFAAYSTFKFSKKIRKQTETQRELYGGYVSWLFEILKGLADIRLLCAQKTIHKEFTSHLRKLFKINIKTSISNLSSDKMIELINLLMQLSIYGICAYLAFKSKITMGNVMVLVSFVFTLKDDTILYLARNFMDAQTRLTRIARIKRFLSEEDESSWPGTKDLVINKGNIEFKNISFSYDSRNPVLQNFSDFIPSGSHIAIIGKSGCGKTTLASLLIGMYEATCGEIYIDGENLTSFNLKSIRENIGIVQQEVLVFDGTIRDNLLLGIARIYLKSPAIIIFDEATSALDSETEKIIHEAWEDLLQGRTAIVIAHRLSSVMLCDRAILMENGRAVASGIPEELMESDESFKELFALKEVYENV